MMRKTDHRGKHYRFLGIFLALEFILGCSALNEPKSKDDCLECDLPQDRILIWVQLLRDDGSNLPKNTVW